MKNIIDKLKAFLIKYPRVVYECKSFLVTFVGIYVAVTGLSETTTLKLVFDNYQMFIGALSMAAFRTLVIYILKLASYDYRSDTAKYK